MLHLKVGSSGLIFVIISVSPCKEINNLACEHWSVLIILISLFRFTYVLMKVLPCLSLTLPRLSEKISRCDCRRGIFNAIRHLNTRINSMSIFASSIWFSCPVFLRKPVHTAVNNFHSVTSTRFITASNSL